MRNENKLYEIIGRLYVDKLESDESAKFWFDLRREQRDKERENREAVPLSGIIREGEA